MNEFLIGELPADIPADDVATIRREHARAWAAGQVRADGTRAGSASGHRAMIRIYPRSRHRCTCGCERRATHVGLGDGVALCSGCELSIRRWVRDGYPA